MNISARLVPADKKKSRGFFGVLIFDFRQNAGARMLLKSHIPAEAGISYYKALT